MGKHGTIYNHGYLWHAGISTQAVWLQSLHPYPSPLTPPMLRSDMKWSPKGSEGWLMLGPTLVVQDAHGKGAFQEVFSLWLLVTHSRHRSREECLPAPEAQHAMGKSAGPRKGLVRPIAWQSHLSPIFSPPTFSSISKNLFQWAGWKFIIRFTTPTSRWLLLSIPCSTQNPNFTMKFSCWNDGLRRNLTGNQSTVSPPN